MAERSDLMEAIMEFEYGNQGWSERLWLAANSYDLALPALALLVAQRRAILPDSADVSYARVSFVGSPRERQVLEEDFPLPGLAHTAHTGYTIADADPNDVEAAVHVEYTTAAGRWANYYYRCLPDNVITARRLGAPLVFVPAPAASPGEATWYERLVNYILLVKDVSVYASLLIAGTPSSPPTYTTSSWSKATPRGISNRKTGAPFGVPRGRRLVG